MHGYSLQTRPSTGPGGAQKLVRRHEVKLKQLKQVGLHHISTELLERELFYVTDFRPIIINLILAAMIHDECNTLIQSRTANLKGMVILNVYKSKPAQALTKGENLMLTLRQKLSTEI